MGVGGGVTAHGIGGPLCFRAHPSTSIAFLAASSRFRYRSFALFSNSCYGFVSASYGRSEMTSEQCPMIALHGDKHISHCHFGDQGQKQLRLQHEMIKNSSGNVSDTRTIHIQFYNSGPCFGKPPSTGGASKLAASVTEIPCEDLTKENRTSNSNDVVVEDLDPVAQRRDWFLPKESNGSSSKAGWFEEIERLKKINKENAQYLQDTKKSDSLSDNNITPLVTMQDRSTPLRNGIPPTSVPQNQKFSTDACLRSTQKSIVIRNSAAFNKSRVDDTQSGRSGPVLTVDKESDSSDGRQLYEVQGNGGTNGRASFKKRASKIKDFLGSRTIVPQKLKLVHKKECENSENQSDFAAAELEHILVEETINGEVVSSCPVTAQEPEGGVSDCRKRLSLLCEKVLVVDDIKVAEKEYENSENQSDFAGPELEDVLIEETVNGEVVSSCPLTAQEPEGGVSDCRKRLSLLCEKVLVVDNIKVAEKVVEKLTGEYRSHIHACDTEVAQIDVKRQTPVGNGQLICFSIYSGPGTDFGDKKTTIWVDVLDGGGQELLMVFAPFFEDSNIKKVWHNYSFDHHVLKNCGINLSGFYADTMHLARLWDSSRSLDGGYSLEALSSDPKVMRRVGNTKNDPKYGAIKMSGRSSNKHNAVAFATRGTEIPSDGSTSEHTIEMNPIGKVSMKTIFGRKKLKKDGSEGKVVILPPVEDLQREDRLPWIGYSSQDSISTYNIFESLKLQLNDRKWVLNGKERGSMYNFYQELWRPFGELLVNMEAEGMLVDKKYLAEIEKVALREQKLVADRFRKWASRHCPDALYMNVGSDTQLRQLFFGGELNRKDQTLDLPIEREFTVPNIDNGLEEGNSTRKHRKITLKKIGERMQAEIYTPNGWPSLSSDGLRTLAGKISTDFCEAINQEDGSNSDIGNTDAFDDQGQILTSEEENEKSVYGSAYEAFGGGKEGSEACHAIAGLCEMSRIDSLISNFILPLQGNDISGKDGRVHCSLNINTETGRLSSRRPNLQNQPALDKDRYKIREAFIAGPGKSLVVADYGQLELRILAHLSNCKSMIEAFEAGGDFHSRTALNMYSHIREAVEEGKVLLEWTPIPGQDKPPLPLLKDAFAAERRKAKMLNFSIAYGKTPMGLSKDWKVSLKEAIETVDLWYKSRQEVLQWQEKRKEEARTKRLVHTVLGRARHFPSLARASNALKSHIERAAINAPVQGSAADIAMLAMLEISSNSALKEMGWKLIMQIHDEVILEGPTETSQLAKDIVVDCMSKPYYGTNFLRVELAVDAKCALNWYSAK